MGQHWLTGSIWTAAAPGAAAYCAPTRLRVPETTRGAPRGSWAHTFAKPNCVRVKIIRTAGDAENDKGGGIEREGLAHNREMALIAKARGQLGWWPRAAAAPPVRQDTHKDQKLNDRNTQKN